MSNVIDLSAEFLDDIDLSDFDAMEAEADSADKGSVYWPSGSSPEKLFDYEIQQDGVTINFTDMGKKFFNVPRKDIENIDHMAFAHYLGLQADSRNDLEKRIEGATGLPFVSYEGIVDAAKNDKRLTISGFDSDPEVGLSAPSKKQVVAQDLSDLVQKCKTNVVSHGQSRSLASVYIEDQGVVKPYMVKFTQSVGTSEKHHEGTMLAFEHAALTALRSHGVSAVPSRLFKSEDSGMHLVTERFDGQQFSASGDASSAYKMFSPVSWMDTVRSGEFKHAMPAQASSKIMSMTANNDTLSEGVMTRYLFDKLIGNADGHGFNVGVVSRIEDSKVRKSLAPAFDVTPYLMDQGNSEAAKDYGLHGLVLSEVGLEDLQKTDALLSEMMATKPEMVTASFEKAREIRDTMINIVENDLVKDGYISASDARSVRSYLETPIGASTPSPSLANGITQTASVFPREESSLDAFKKRALGREDLDKGNSAYNY